MRYELIYQWIYLIVMIGCIVWGACLIHKRKKDAHIKEHRTAEREAGRCGFINKQR